MFFYHTTGLTVPLVTTESGNKFGKTAGNAVWLDKEKTSSFELYQFFLRTADSQVENYLNVFTFMKQNEIEAIMRKHEVGFCKVHMKRVLSYLNRINILL